MASRSFVDIPFGSFEPDWGGMPRPDVPGYLVDAVNIRSTPNGYRGLPAFADVTSPAAASAATEYGSGTCFFTTGSTVVDGGTGQTWFVPGEVNFFFVNAEGLISRSNDEGDTWTDYTPNTGATLDSFGDFIHFGIHVIYVCGSRVPIAFDLTTPTDFFDLVGISSGTPPVSSCGARIRQHVVVGYDTTITTSAIGTAQDWPTPGSADARSKQCIEEDLGEQYGTIRRILGGDKFGIIVQDTALTRMTYVGGSVVFEFDTYERVLGAGFNRYSRFATDGNLWYWYNDVGFFATDGYSVKNLSEGKIQEAIFRDVLSHDNGDLPTAQTIAYDANRSLVIMGSRQSDQDQLCYNTKDGSFSFMRDSGVMTLISGYSDASHGAPIAYNIQATSRELQRLDAATGTIALQTGYIELDPGYRFQLHGAHILGTGTGSLTLAYKTAATSAACDISQSSFTSLTAAGLGEKKTGRASAQYIAFRITGTGAESQLIRGIRVYFQRVEPSP